MKTEPEVRAALQRLRNKTNRSHTDWMGILVLLWVLSEAPTDNDLKTTGL